jgi:hypothetical protein
MKLLRLMFFPPLLLLPSCVHVSTDPIEVKPITINVNLKVDRELDQFFAFENKENPATTQHATTEPSATAQ